MPRSRLGSVVHSVTSRDGSFSFRATDEWEATEIAPGGYEGAKEVIPEKWLDRHPEIFVQGATLRSWHEQSGECLWGGRIRDIPSRNGGRAEISVQGWGQLADRNAGRLLYMSTDLSAWTVNTYSASTESPNRWNPAIEAGQLSARRTRHPLFNDEITLATSAAADDIIDTTSVHPFESGDKVVFTALTGGAGLTVGTAYFVRGVNLGNTTFEVSATSGGAKVNFTTDITAGTVQREVGSNAWRSVNGTEGFYFMFRTPGNPQISRLAFNLAMTGRDQGACSVVVQGGDSTSVDWFDAYVKYADLPQTLHIDVSLSDPPIGASLGAVEVIQIAIWDLLNYDGGLTEKYGAWPAFRPSDITDDYDSWTDALSLAIGNVRVGGIATTDYFSTSSVARDIAARLGVSDHDVDDFGYNALPLDVRDGMTYAEALDHVSLLSNARWLIHDTGTRKYMDFGKFDKRKWTVADPHQDIDLLPLERFDRVVIPYRLNDGKSMASLTVVADPNPLDYPNSFGRVRLNDDITYGTGNEDPGWDAASAIGERLVDHLVKQRWGGSANLSHVQDHNGVTQSAYFVHAGDVLRVPDRRARARISGKSMTNRGVSVEFEENYAPLDRLLARREKRMQRV